MVGPDQRWWLTYNGEIFNHLKLRSQLPTDRYRGGSDTETLLHALAAWDVGAIERCNGLFALAALDVKGRRLILARDRFGIKPLYIAWHDGTLWFASEIRALLEVGVPRRVRADVLARTVVHGWANGPLTPIEGIVRVLPGTYHSIGLDDLDATEHRWYEPPCVVDAECAARLHALSRQDAAAGVEQALRLAVSRRLMADVPVGTMCSGGIDSSLITAFAADEHPGVHAFNISISDQPAADESRYASAVAEQIGVELHTIEQTGESWRADLVGVVRHVEYPLTHESSVSMAQIAARARSLGFKVLLSGEGADELFGGYPGRHVREEKDFATRHRAVPRLTRALYRRLQRHGFRAPDNPFPGPMVAIRAYGQDLIDRAAAGAGNGGNTTQYERDVIERAEAAYAHHPSAWRRLEARLAADLGNYLPFALNRQDKSTMRASIETRVPFLDPDFVALVLNLPLEHRVEPERKGVLRDLARRYLPQGIAERPKMGFMFDVRSYLAPAARPEFLENGLLRDVFRMPSGDWKAAIAEAGAHPQRLLHLWTGEIWCRAVLEGTSTDAVERDLWHEFS